MNFSSRIIALNSPEQDERIGKRARSYDGFEAEIEKIIKHPDGWECICLIDHKTGIGQGGLETGQYTILE